MTGWRRAVRHLGRCSETRLVSYLTLFFLATRLGFLIAGVRFDARPLDGYWQYLDPTLLRQDLLRSLLYLHSQPPLFNLFLGLVLKLSPFSPAISFHGLYLLFGLICYLSSFILMLRLSVSRGLAFLLSTAVVCRPSFLLFENWLMYDVPVTALLGLAALAFATFSASRSRAAALCFFTSLAALCATRSLYHLVYFAAVIVLAVALFRDQRQRLLKAAAAPCLFLILLYAKNLMLFSHPGLSTWVGMNLSRITRSALTPSELEELRLAGHLTAVSALPPFSPPAQYPQEYFDNPRYPQVPALADHIKSTGSVNYNQEAYIEISRDYLQDALLILEQRPAAYLHGVAKAWYNYFKPQTQLAHVSLNRERLSLYVTWCEPLLYGRLPWAPRYGDSPKPIYLFTTVGFPLLILYGLVSIFGFPGRYGAPDQRTRHILAFLCLTILYTALVGNSLEVWENQRFRFYTDPFYVAILAVAISRFRTLARQSEEQATPSSR